MARDGEAGGDYAPGVPVASPFSLLTATFGDGPMAELFSEAATVRSWLDVEAALATVQAELGILANEDADAIRDACAAVPTTFDRQAFWSLARVTGYPIVPTVRAIVGGLPPGPGGRVHYGATTQDIMDTGLALQMRAALDRLDGLLLAVGDAVAGLVDRHRATVVAARTHAQQAVPTTFGMKLAPLLAEVMRHRERVAEARPRVAVVSLYGAGGTNAAMGPQANEIRVRLAARLRLGVLDASWHVARDGVAEFGFLCAATAATAGRFAREVVDLSRTEIGEVSERVERGRGASSTMPQKVNPVASEAVVGLAATASSLSGGLLRAMQGGHERSAGEWQIEWFVVPHLSCLAAGALATTLDVLEGLQVNSEAMRRNLAADGGLIMAEAWMIRLAERLGRETAYETVKSAVERVRADGGDLRSAVSAQLDGRVPIDDDVTPDDYLGESEAACSAILDAWVTARRMRSS